MSVVSDSPSSLIYKLSKDREQVLEFIMFYKILYSILPSWEEAGRDLTFTETLLHAKAVLDPSMYQLMQSSPAGSIILT